MLLAEFEFWKWPTIVELVGVVLALASIWLSWWLAKLDFRRRIAEAEERVAVASRAQLQKFEATVFRTALFAALRSLELSRESCRGKNWPRACELCELARDQLAQVLGQVWIVPELRDRVELIPVKLAGCILELRKLPRKGTGQLGDEVRQVLDDSIHTLHQVDGKIPANRPENANG